MRVRRIGGVHRDREPSRIEAVHGRCGRLQRRPPRVLVVVNHEDTALPINPTIGSVDEVVSTVVRIGRVEPLQENRPFVGDVVAIGVFEEHQFGLEGDDYSTIPELEAKRI